MSEQKGFTPEEGRVEDVEKARAMAEAEDPHRANIKENLEAADLAEKSADHFRKNQRIYQAETKEQQAHDLKEEAAYENWAADDAAEAASEKFDSENSEK